MGSGIPPWHDRRSLHSGTGISGDSRYRRCPARSAPHSASPGSPQHSGKPPWWGCTGPRFCTGTGCCSEAPSDHRRRLRLGKERVAGISVGVDNGKLFSTSLPLPLERVAGWPLYPSFSTEQQGLGTHPRQYVTGAQQWTTFYHSMTQASLSCSPPGLCSASFQCLECCVWCGQSLARGGCEQLWAEKRPTRQEKWTAYSGALDTSRSLDCI